MNLKSLPSEERPRERFIKYGRDNISNEELIEIILKSGTRKYGLKEISLTSLSLNMTTLYYLILLKSIRTDKLISVLILIIMFTLILRY